MGMMGRIQIMIFWLRRGISMLPISPILPISSPRAANVAGLGGAERLV
jgi:hypothetical protein